MLRCFLLLYMVFAVGVQAIGQESAIVASGLAKRELIALGIPAADLAQLRVTDSYVDTHTGVRHTWLRQQWLGIDIFNSEAALH